MVAGLPIERRRAAWWTVGGALLAVLAVVVHAFIGTFVFGVFIYYATRPVHRTLDPYIRPASVSALAALLLLVTPLLILAGYTIALGLAEASRLLDAVDIAQIEAALEPYLDISRTVQDPEQLLQQPELLRSVAAELLGGTVASVGVLGTAAIHAFVMLAVAFYLLRDDHRLAAWATDTFDGPTFERYGRAVNRSFSSIFFGNIVTIVLTGVIGAVVYHGLNLVAPGSVTVPSPTLLGVLTGVASLIPIVGMKIVYVPAAGYIGLVAARVDTGLLWFPAAFLLVSFIVVDIIPDLLFRPYVSGRNLHMGMVMLAYVLGPLLFGWYGLFLGPMVLVVLVQFARVVLPELVGGRAEGFEGSGFEAATEREP